MTTVIVAGALANKPGNGGEAWVRMSWARGLARLGFDVWFVESLAARGGEDPNVEPEALEFFDRVTDLNGFAGRRVLLVDGDARGLPRGAWDDLVADCVMLVNISGNLAPGPWLDRIQHRVYVDLDPGYTQIWHEEGLLGDALAAHTAHYTVGLNVGTEACDLPTGPFEWRPILQPVVLDDWSYTDRDSPPALRFTTVASWRGAFGTLCGGGREYGAKAHEWRRFVALPTLARDHRFEAALAIHDADHRDRAALEAAGWIIEDPARRAGSPGSFRDYVAGSDAEFSVAQGVYVEESSGWFSDRSARYLAAGRPVLVQDTGFDRTLPVGQGLLGFDSMSSALRGAEALASDYPAHSRAARTLAEEFFDSDQVLGRMIEELDVCP